MDTLDETVRQAIIDLHRQGKTLREIEQLVFGYTGGHSHVTVERVIREAKTGQTGQNPR